MKRYLSCILALTLLVLPAVSLSGMPVAQANQKVYRQVTPADNARARSMLEQANQLRAAGNYEQAIAMYTKAIHINERLGGYAGRALCYFQMGNLEQAERDANTSIHQRSAKDLMLPGMMGMAEYVRGVCRYQRGEYAAAEADLKTAVASRYGNDDVQRMYHDCVQKAQAAREQAVIDEIRNSYRNVESVVVQALQEKKLAGFDVSRGDPSWWRSEEDRADFEKTMFGTVSAGGSAALQSITGYLWQMYIAGSDTVEIVAFVPRHTIIGGTYYRDKVIMVTLTPVPVNISKVADLPAATRLYDTHMVENGGLSEIRHSLSLDVEEQGYTWESLGQEIIRQQGEAEYGYMTVLGLPNDYNITPKGDGVYILTDRYGRTGYEPNAKQETSWLRRINCALPPLP